MNGLILNLNGMRVRETSRYGNTVEFLYEDVEGVPWVKGSMPAIVWDQIFVRERPEEVI